MWVRAGWVGELAGYDLYMSQFGSERTKDKNIEPLQSLRLERKYTCQKPGKQTHLQTNSRKRIHITLPRQLRRRRLFLIHERKDQLRRHPPRGAAEEGRGEGRCTCGAGEVFDDFGDAEIGDEGVAFVVD